VVNSGYLESIKQLRENLMLHEWELSNKYWAKRKSVLRIIPVLSFARPSD
jgi:hypothetical protein